MQRQVIPLTKILTLVAGQAEACLPSCLPFVSSTATLLEYFDSEVRASREMGTLQYPRLLLIGNDRTSSAESSLTAAAFSVRPLTTDGLQEKLKELVVRAVPRSERRTGSGEQRARTFNSTAYSTMYSTTASSTFRRCNGVASEQICKCVGSLSFFLC